MESRDHPVFGDAQAIYNVIDSHQADPQANVIEALSGLGYTEAASHYVHFSYEMVALTPRCALDWVIALRGGQGRLRRGLRAQGLGVKADDCRQTDEGGRRRSRPPASAAGPEEREAMAHQIAVGALRYFMLKFTRNTVIAFDSTRR